MNKLYNKILDRYGSKYEIYTSEDNSELSIIVNDRREYNIQTKSNKVITIEIIYCKRKFQKKFKSYNEAFRFIDASLKGKLEHQYIPYKESPDNDQLVIKHLVKALYRYTKTIIAAIVMLLWIISIPFVIVGTNMALSVIQNNTPETLLPKLAEEMIPLPLFLNSAIIGLKWIIDVLKNKNTSIKGKTLEYIGTAIISVCETLMLLAISESLKTGTSIELFIISLITMVPGVFIVLAGKRVYKERNAEDTLILQRLPIYPSIEETEKLISEVAELSDVTEIAMRVDTENAEEPSVTDNKLYGQPYWSIDELDDIKSKLGVHCTAKMVFQINLEDLNIGKTGILQIYYVEGFGKFWYNKVYHKRVYEDKQASLRDLEFQGIKPSTNSLKLKLTEEANSIGVDRETLSSLLNTASKKSNIRLDELITYERLMTEMSRQPSKEILGNAIGAKSKLESEMITLLSIDAEKIEEITGEINPHTDSFKSYIRVVIDKHEFEKGNFDKCYIHTYILNYDPYH